MAKGVTLILFSLGALPRSHSCGVRPGRVQTAAPTGVGFGVYVTGSASFDTIENNYVHDLCEDGIYLDPDVSHISILNNKINHAEMSGVNPDGTNDLVQGNEVWATSQYPGRSGGIYSVCSSRSGADADGMRFFGQNHLVKGNYFHDIAFGTTENPNPHTDCWQTWGGTKTVSGLFDGNRCRWPSQAHDNSGGGEEACEIEALDSAVTNITMQNNVIANMFQGFQIGQGIGPVAFLNNTIDHIQQEGIIYQDSRTKSDRVISNIFYDVGQGGDPFITSCSPTISNNDFFMRSGSPGSGCTFISKNPHGSFMSRITIALVLALLAWASVALARTTTSTRSATLTTLLSLTKESARLLQRQRPVRLRVAAGADQGRTDTDGEVDEQSIRGKERGGLEFEGPGS